MNAAYYNENDAEKAAVIRELIRANVVAPGDVDERSITDVSADDVRGYTQCHWFAGFGVWSYALRLAGWADDRAVWTGSCPCQPFSSAGKRDGFTDERHLWPEWFRLINACRPPVIFGEQVSSSINGTASENASVQTLQGRETILRVLRELQGKPSEYMQGMYERTGARIQTQSSRESGEELSGVARQEARTRAGECGPVSSEEERAALHPGPRGHSSENRPWSLRSHGNPVRSYQASLMELTVFGQDRFDEGIHAGERESDSLFLECDGECLGHPEGSGSGQCDPRAAHQAQRRIDRIFGRCFEGESLWSWLDLISANLEETGYTRWPVVLGAHSAGAPHIRQRLYFVGSRPDAESERAGRNTGSIFFENGRPIIGMQREPFRDVAVGVCADTGCKAGEGRSADRSERPDTAPEARQFSPARIGSIVGQLSDTESERLREARSSSGRSTERAGDCGEPIERTDALHTERRPLMQHGNHGRNGADAGRPEAHGQPGTCGEVRECLHADEHGAERQRGAQFIANGGCEAGAPCDSSGNGSTARLPESAQREEGITSLTLDTGNRSHRGEGWLDPDAARSATAAGATRGFWADCDWWYGRDGKYRPIGRGISPLVSGAAQCELLKVASGTAGDIRLVRALGETEPESGEARVLRLRGYGDAINAEVAKAFIAAYMEATEDVG